jgi:hypothetical protein
MDADAPAGPLIDESAIDVAAQRESFTGVVTIDVGDERRYERVAAFAHRALDVRNTPRIYTTADDLHAFWRALTGGRIIGEGTLARMTEPRFDVPSESMRYGLGLYLGATGPQLVMEGYDAGVSFRSTHNPVTCTTVSVLGNSSEGAWPLVSALADLA